VFQLRLSQILSNRAFGPDIEIMLYHGTSTYYERSFQQIKIIEPQRRKIRDFGTGFYTTTQYWQAVRYANLIAETLGGNPMIVCVSTTLGALRKFSNYLIVDEYNLKWMETIIQGRWIAPLPYDWIYGRCGDGNTLKVHRKYEEGASTEELLEMATPDPRKITYYYDQLWFGTEKVTQILTIRGIMKLTEGSVNAPVQIS
jgi:hypothetical protein